MKKNGWTALMYASVHGHIDIVKVLVDNGAKMNLQDRISGNTALIWATREGRIGVAKYLIDKGANMELHNHVSS